MDDIRGLFIRRVTRGKIQSALHLVQRGEKKAQRSESVPKQEWSGGGY